MGLSLRKNIQNAKCKSVNVFSLTNQSQCMCYVYAYLLMLRFIYLLKTKRLTFDLKSQRLKNVDIKKNRRPYYKHNTDV